MDALMADHRFSGELPWPVQMFIQVEATSFLHRFHAADGSECLQVAVEVDALQSHLSEYFGICREMGSRQQGTRSPRIEALDIAKRLVHDEAAQAVRRIFALLGPDHATARRLFTLLVTLHFDTATLARPHHLDAALAFLRDRGRG
jgi:uncharacterized protein (UPF0262 family)